MGKLIAPGAGFAIDVPSTAGFAIELSADNTTAQLIAASELLINESITTIINISLEELDNKQVGKLAKLTLKQIDESMAVIDVLKPVPDVSIQRAIVQLHQTIDQCFTALNQHYTELQNRILMSDCDSSDLINYAAFCHELALKLLTRASKSVVPQQHDLVADAELQKYL